jgi:hypothetical protein
MQYLYLYKNIDFRLYNNAKYRYPVAPYCADGLYSDPLLYIRPLVRLFIVCVCSFVYLCQTIRYSFSEVCESINSSVITNPFFI